ncbi:unnamed protein product [Psylliodes chrysocephalus]|uniref:Uncharacterized protein n=1 Tax=Psylliodes chrysocephalus TaxID=3402493 RepID=A0A9P0CTL5_9CUCU|nr:unnamed protein product [Psylliodes chrysocephala]
MDGLPRNSNKGSSVVNKVCNTVHKVIKNQSKPHFDCVESARRPVPHNEEIPVPVCTTLPDVSMLEVEEIEDQYSNSSESEYKGIQSTPQQFSQEELNDLIRDLGLSKQTSQLLASVKR